MFRTIGITKEFAERTIFHNVSFTVGSGEKVGLVGPNGSGKSTLLKVLGKTMDFDTGSIKHDGTGIAYFDQNMLQQLDITVGEFLSNGMRSQNASISQNESSEVQPNGSSFADYALECALGALGLTDVEPGRRLSRLSGGQQFRIGLLRCFMVSAELLLLDEPTNNLDERAIDWLETRLRDSEAACILASHDRRFLDNVTTRTLVLDPLTSTIRDYSGNYSFYTKRLKEETNRQWREYSEQQIRVTKLTKDIVSIKQRALKTEHSTVNDFYRGKAKKVAATAKARENRLSKMLSDKNRWQKPIEQSQIRLTFTGEASHRNPLIELRECNVSIEGKTILTDVTRTIYGGERIAVIGPNGSGKSTLIKLLAGEITPDCGQVWTKGNPVHAYLPQMQEYLPQNESVLNFFRNQLSDSSKGPKTPLSNESEIRTFLHRFLFSGSDVHKPIGVISQGERTRLILATFIAKEPAMLLLDEPTNHLDVASIEQLESAIAGYRGALVVASHDRRFLEALQIKTEWRLSDGVIC